MTKPILVLIAVLFSLNANAELITYNNDYTLDTEANIVTGGGLQWLQWDETRTLSRDEALTTFSADGWRLASYSEVIGLLLNWYPDVEYPLQEFGIASADFSYSFYGAVGSDPNVYYISALYDGGFVEVETPPGNTTWITAGNGRRDPTFAGVALVRTSVVPLPAAGWLFLCGLTGLAGLASKNRRSCQKVLTS